MRHFVHIITVLGTTLFLSCENGDFLQRQYGQDAFPVEQTWGDGNPGGTVFCQYQPVGKRGEWGVNDTAVFTISPFEHPVDGKFSLSVRYLPAYPWKNLQLRTTLVEISPRRRRIRILKTKNLTGKLLLEQTQVDTLQSVTQLKTWTSRFQLFTDATVANTHRWKCDNLGVVNFKSGYTYQLRVVHCMRQAFLQGITDIGVKIDSQE